MLTIRRVRLASLRSFWTQAERDNPDMSPYQYYDTVRLIRRRYLFFMARRLEFPRFFAVFEDGRPILAVPACLSLRGGRARYVSFGASATLAFQNLIYPRDMAAEKLSECLDVVLRRLGRFEFHRVGEHTLLNRVLSARSAPVKQNVNVAIAAADSYDAYFASLSRNTRQNVRTAYNRLAADGLDYGVEVYRPGELPARRLRALMDLYIARRRGRYDLRSGLHAWFLRHYHYNTVGFSALREGMYVVLSIQGSPAAFWGGYVDRLGRYVLVPRLAINDAFSRYSPGMLLINETMKRLQAEWRLDSLDLSKGGEAYKYRMGGVDYLTLNYSLTRSDTL